MNSASPALRVDHLAKQYAGGQGVSDVSFTVEPGQITGFIGVNGAGKSTTLRCILGLSEPDAGDIEIFGERASFRARMPLGFLPEERGLAPRPKLHAVPRIPSAPRPWAPDPDRAAAGEPALSRPWR